MQYIYGYPGGVPLLPPKSTPGGVLVMILCPVEADKPCDTRVWAGKSGHTLVTTGAETGWISMSVPVALRFA